MFWAIVEAVVIVAIYTFLPALAVYPSEWMRVAWGWIKNKTGFGVAKQP